MSRHIALYYINLHLFSHKHTQTGLVGLVISYALTVSNFLNSVVGSLTETERELVSVERVHQYLEGAPGEHREGSIIPPFGWVSHGSLRFHNVYLRYQLVTPSFIVL